MAKKNVTKEDVFNFIENMTILELSQFLTEAEERFGVSPMPMTQMPGIPAPSEEKEREPTGWEITLDGFDSKKKIPVIKAIRKEVVGLGLKDAKDFVEAAPSIIQESCLSEKEANRIKEAVEKDGGKVSIKAIYN